MVANGDWLAGLAVPQILELASTFTVQQFLARDNYRRRVERGDPVGLHEFLYALLQGYDAVHLRADVQLGETASSSASSDRTAATYSGRIGWRPGPLVT